MLGTTLRVAGCATRFTARQYRTTAGSELRRRIDSRTAASAVDVHAGGGGGPRPGARHPGGADPRRHAGRRAPVRAAAGAWPPPGEPVRRGRLAGVSVRGRTIAVTALPASTGIVDLTVYQVRAPRGAPLLPAGARATAVATVMARAPGGLSRA